MAVVKQLWGVRVGKLPKPSAFSGPARPLVHRQLARPDAGERRIEVGVHEEARGVVLVARHHAQAGAGGQQIAYGAQMHLVDLVEEDLRGEAAHLVDRVQMLQHRIDRL